MAAGLRYNRAHARNEERDTKSGDLLERTCKHSGSATQESAHSHIDDMGELYCMKKIGFLSFGHWTPSPQSQARSATDVLLQSIDLAVEAERLGMDGAYFGFITSRSNSHHRSHCSRRLV